MTFGRVWLYMIGLNWFQEYCHIRILMEQLCGWQENVFYSLGRSNTSGCYYGY